MNIGCHVSIDDDIFRAPERAKKLGCECFQIFSRSPHGGKSKELTKDVVAKFQKELRKARIQNVYIHTPYFINFASLNNRIRYGSISVVREDLERGSILGAKYVMTHLGSAGELSEKEATEKVIAMLTKMLDGYTGQTKLLIENAAGAGRIIGATFSQIKKIITKVNHRALVGVCLDTQHSFASGYDFHTPAVAKKTFAKIEKELGKNMIKMMHANDSKVEFNSRRDRHEHIGKGHIGKEGFAEIVSYAQRNDSDMVLETEHDFVESDIRILKKLRDEKK